jgi:CheY-like chemotaxis protein
VRGKVTLSVDYAHSGWTPGHPGLSRAGAVMAFSVTDTGVGIPADKLQLIFEAFQQADGSTARKYGGTGLGLSISRELARLLDGEIRVHSEVNLGSSFTLYLPYRAPDGQALPVPVAELSPATMPELTMTQAAPSDFIMDVGRKVLIVEDDAVQRNAIAALVSLPNVEVMAVETGGQALQALKSGRFDCMVFDLKLPDIDGYDLLEMINRDERLRGMPVVIHSASEIGVEDAARLHRLVKAVVIKDARSSARLLEETLRILGLEGGSQAPPSTELFSPEEAKTLAGRQVLIVDDDLRNIFALSSVLERQGMTVLFAENGREGIEMLESSERVDIVLMDIMMPEMDGYDTTRAIRRLSRFADLPIITLTAKAMKGDREKCIAAGASDYITKPVDVHQLLTLMRFWLDK